MILAHISPDQSREQSLRDHLMGTAELAEQFAKPFGCAEQARLVALVHDLGKVQPEFQDRLQGKSKKVDHSTYGLQLLHDDRLLAMCAGAHHTGLMDVGDIDTPGSYEARLNKTLNITLPDEFKDISFLIKKHDCSLLQALMNDWIEKGWILHPEQKLSANQFLWYRWLSSFYTRMIFSCLVDADYLDTERFMKGDTVRPISASMEELRTRLNHFFDSTMAGRKGSLNLERDRIRTCCIQAAKFERGIFTLSVPTGGGKTLSSLSFAIEHAIRHHLQRIIYVIPYTSIIDQTANIFSSILGEENVLAHHAQAEFFVSEIQANDPDAQKKKLAAENWDMPIIVTTNVQFFESLHSSRTSSCRKLHNIAGSVIIFDEVQLFSLKYLTSLLANIATLQKHFSCTCLLCTATQPDFADLLQARKLIAVPHLQNLPFREIYQNPKPDIFQRVTYEPLQEALSEETLIKRLSEEGRSVLCIVNTRKRAQTLYLAMKELKMDHVYHLSTWMTAYDRKRILDLVRRRLTSGNPCILVSTSLVEAGVDMDFPTVYREINGLDSVIQAAGRCNREGKNKTEDCRVYIFSFDDTYGLAKYQSKIDAYRKVINSGLDLQNPEAIKKYYQFYYSLIDPEGAIHQGKAFDTEEIISKLSKFHFKEADSHFRLIEDDNNCTLYIHYESEDYNNRLEIEDLKSGNISRETLRSLGKAVIQINQKHYNRLLQLPCTKELDTVDQPTAIVAPKTIYHGDYGLDINGNMLTEDWCL